MELYGAPLSVAIDNGKAGGRARVGARSGREEEDSDDEEDEDEDDEGEEEAGEFMVLFLRQKGSNGGGPLTVVVCDNVGCGTLIRELSHPPVPVRAVKVADPSQLASKPSNASAVPKGIPKGIRQGAQAAQPQQTSVGKSLVAPCVLRVANAILPAIRERVAMAAKKAAAKPAGSNAAKKVAEGEGGGEDEEDEEDEAGAAAVEVKLIGHSLGGSVAAVSFRHCHSIHPLPFHSNFTAANETKQTTSRILEFYQPDKQLTEQFNDQSPNTYTITQLHMFVHALLFQVLSGMLSDTILLDSNKGNKAGSAVAASDGTQVEASCIALGVSQSLSTTRPTSPVPLSSPTSTNLDHP